jgi:AmiR/NasT family two-component response regulator
MTTPDPQQSLVSALAANRLVNTALGMLMWRYAVDEHDAFRMLSDASRWTGRTVAELAGMYIDTGDVGLDH